MRSQQLRRGAIIALVFVLAVAIFWQSWQATVAGAADGGRPNPEWWPVTLEGLLAVLVLVYWDARHDRRPFAWVVQVAVWLVTAAAAAVQVLDAPATWLGWTTAALTPAMLLLAVEFTVWLLYGGVVVAEESTSREGSAPRPPGPDAGSVAGMAGSSQPSRLAPATPPLSPTPAAEPVASRPSAEAGSLPDEPRPVTPVATVPTDRDQTVPRLPAGVDKKIEAGLYRRQDNPEKFEEYITAKGLDRDEVMAMARRRGYPVANGHQKAVPA